MRILLLTQYFPPEFGACAGRNSEHAALWAQAGHDVEVCTAVPNYPAGVIPDEYRGKFFVRERRDGYSVLRSWVYATPNRAVWRRALASLSFLASAFFTGAARCKRPDVIIASSGPFFVGPLGYLLSLAKRAPFVFEVRDILPQQAVDVGMLKNRLVIRALYAIEEFLYRRARCIVTVAEASRQSILARGFGRGKCFTVENGIREEFFAPQEKENEIRAQYGWSGKFIAMYIGAHGVSQGLYVLLDAAERLREHNDILFVFVGDGADKPGLMARAEERGLANVVFLPLQPKERMPSFYAAADVCLAPLRAGEYFRINIPSKIFEVLACERPVLLGAEGQARQIVDESGAGVVVPPENGAAYAEAILDLRRSPERIEALGKRGRAYVLQRFTRRQKAKRYIEVLENALATSAHEER